MLRGESLFSEHLGGYDFFGHRVPLGTGVRWFSRFLPSSHSIGPGVFLLWDSLIPPAMPLPLSPMSLFLLTPFFWFAQSLDHVHSLSFPLKWVFPPGLRVFPGSFRPNTMHMFCYPFFDCFSLASMWSISFCTFRLKSGIHPVLDRCLVPRLSFFAFRDFCGGRRMMTSRFTSAFAHFPVAWFFRLEYSDFCTFPFTFFFSVHASSFQSALRRCPGFCPAGLVSSSTFFLSVFPLRLSFDPFAWPFSFLSSFLTLLWPPPAFRKLDRPMVVLFFPRLPVPRFFAGSALVFSTIFPVFRHPRFSLWPPSPLFESPHIFLFLFFVERMLEAFSIFEAGRLLLGQVFSNVFFHSVGWSFLARDPLHCLINRWNSGPFSVIPVANFAFGRSPP